MAGKQITMERIRDILKVLNDSGSIRKTVDTLGVSRNTVRKFIDRLESQGITIEDALMMDLGALSKVIHPPKPPDGSARWKDFEVRLQGLKEDLQSNKHMTRQLLWEEYRESNPDGYGYTQFCKHLGDYLECSDVVASFNHVPGEVMEVDFAGAKFYGVDPATGKPRGYDVLICTFPFSKYFFLIALESAKQADFIAGLVTAFAFFGGVAKLIVFDNMRVAVTKTDRYSPDFTTLLQQLAEHYGTVCTATRPAKPRDKATVEASVRWSYTRIFARMRDKVYHGAAEINVDFRRYLKELLGRNFQRREESRHDLFTQVELPELLPLPKESFRPKRVRSVKVRANAHVIVSEDNHFYSVPHRLVGKQVRVVYDTHFVEVFYNHDRVATHVRSRAELGYTTNKEHLPPHLIAVYNNRAMTADDFIDRARAIGPNTAIVLERIIASKAFPVQTLSSCEGLLRLAGKHGKDQLEAACTMAASREGWSRYTVVRDLVTSGVSKAPPKSFKVPSHENVRGASNYS